MLFHSVVSLDGCGQDTLKLTKLTGQFLYSSAGSREKLLNGMRQPGVSGVTDIVAGRTETSECGYKITETDRELVNQDRIDF